MRGGIPLIPRRTAFVALLLTLVLVLPAAGATHLATYYTRTPGGEPVDPSPGLTSEPDEAVASTPGSALDGLQNRVSATGGVGGGELFLDARVAHRVQPGNQGPYLVFAAEHLAATLADRPNVLLPGPHATLAWYGWWTDSDGNGRIDDLQDTSCEPAPSCAGDEFRFRGRATDEEIPMPYFVYPRADFHLPFVANVGLFGVGERSHSADSLQDYTDHEDPMWYDAGGRTTSSWSVNGPYDTLLVTFTHVTIANAPRDSSPLGWDVFHPDALIDVDVYEAVNPDAESLYLAVAQTALKPVTREISTLSTGGWDTGIATVNEAVALARSFTEDAGGAEAIVMGEVTPPWPKEPNHEEDDFDGNALYGGVGDVLGTGNVYPGYAAGFEYLVDARGGLRFTYGNIRDNLFHHEPLPSASENTHKRQAGFVFSMIASFDMWHDHNGDGYPGYVCDPQDPDAWDSAAGTCREAPIVPSGTTPAGAPRETVSVCSTSVKARIRLDPVGGSWPGAVVLRKQGDYSAMAIEFATDREVRVDSDPIFLDWWPCTTATHSRAASSDVVLFPGSNLAIGVKTTVTAMSGSWFDPSGIQHAGGDTVTDVDLYHPVL